MNRYKEAICSVIALVFHTDPGEIVSETERFPGFNLQANMLCIWWIYFLSIILFQMITRYEKRSLFLDPYIRVSIFHDGNLLKKKKTSTKKATCSPTYNQAINFAIPLHVLPQVEIHFTVVHETG